MSSDQSDLTHSCDNSCDTHNSCDTTFGNSNSCNASNLTCDSFSSSSCNSDNCSKLFSSFDSSNNSDNCSCLDSNTNFSCNFSSSDNKSSLSCDFDNSDSECPEDNCDNKVTVDLATTNVTFSATSDIDFVGTKGSSQGYIYKGHALKNLQPFTPANSNSNSNNRASEKRKVIGTFTNNFTIVNPEFNQAIVSLLEHDLPAYLAEITRLSGRVLLESQMTLSFSDSKDFYLPSEDTIVVSGREPWGVKGEEWKMAVLGGTGQYQHATGQAEVKRLIVANGSENNFSQSLRLVFCNVTDC